MYKLNVYQKGNVIKEATIQEGESILDAFQNQGIYISAACGGTGKCGKCGVKILKGDIPVQEADRRFFSEEEIKEGMRLSCLAKAIGDLEVEIVTDTEEEFEIIAEGGQAGVEGDMGIAIDIGTTTIAVSLVRMSDYQVVDTVATVNHQRSFGGDVISRIQAANEGDLENLSKAVRKDLYESIVKVCEKHACPVKELKLITIAGNTTMGHLLMGFSCETLGVSPFTPVDISAIETDAVEMFGAFGMTEPVSIKLVPGITTYVGADIVAGMLETGFDQKQEVSVLIDLGTNGEMGIGNKDKIMVTSTAAGPAFEGGNISCGVGGIPGAISGVTIDGEQVSVTTIGDAKPLGICGTGVVETVYELVKEELVDEAGGLEEDYFDDGFKLADDKDGNPITFTQKDVREIQLAKSAIRAGMETLIKRYGVGFDEISKVYLAGGFGYKMDVAKAVGIGMFPEELLPKIEAIGNSSLKGAIDYMDEKDNQARAQKIVDLSEEISLATDKTFNDLYMEYMYFE
ncbi:MAG: ASKHA domain-containing protein [Eubacterium sp.]|nr:ASKHA domain-containing protein [Eubacterium sp.]